MNKIWREYPNIRQDLDKVKQQIFEVNKSSEKYLNDSLDYLLMTGGKMLRPTFVLIGSLFQEHDEDEKIINIAAAIETIHMATLIHDDIVDDSDLRRGQPSIQAKYSKEYAVYMGDYLFTQVFMMLSKYDYTRENLYDISRGISKVCIGELMQNQMRYNVDVQLKDYLKIVAGKTAALFAVSLGIGANIAGVPDKMAKKLAKIGYNVGMAFQIIDDILDYSGSDKTVGKNTLIDLSNGYYTLPVIYALRYDLDKSLEKTLTNLAKTHDITSAVEFIRSSDGLKKAKKLANRYTDRAMKLINELPDGEGKEILNALIPELIKRVY